MRQSSISLTTRESSKECGEVIPAHRTQRWMTAIQESKNRSTLTSGAVANNCFGSVHVKYKRMRQKKAIYFWDWEAFSWRQKSFLSWNYLPEMWQITSLNTPLLALFLAQKANGQIENTPCSAMCVRGLLFCLWCSPTAKKQQTCMLKCSASHLAPCDGNLVTVDMPFESHQSLLWHLRWLGDTHPLILSQTLSDSQDMMLVA